MFLNRHCYYTQHKSITEYTDNISEFAIVDFIREKYGYLTLTTQIFAKFRALFFGQLNWKIMHMLSILTTEDNRKHSDSTQQLQHGKCTWFLSYNVPHGDR